MASAGVSVCQAGYPKHLKMVSSLERGRCPAGRPLPGRTEQRELLLFSAQGRVVQVCLSELLKALKAYLGVNTITTLSHVQLSAGKHATPWHPLGYRVRLAVSMLRSVMLHRHIPRRCKTAGWELSSCVSLQNQVRQLTKSSAYLLSP